MVGLVSTTRGLQQPLKLQHILSEPVLVSKLQFQHESGIRKDHWEILMLKFNVTVPNLHTWGKCALCGRNFQSIWCKENAVLDQ